MKNGVAALFLCIFAIFCLAAGSKVKGFVVTFHLEGQAEDSAKFVTPVKLGSEHRQYYFKKVPEFNDKDISWFYPFISQDGASFGAAFRLNAKATQELTNLTIANQGRLMGTRVLDAPLRAVIIDRPIDDGVLVIWDGLSQNHLKLINSKIPHVDRIRGGSETPGFALPTNRKAAAPSQSNPANTANTTASKGTGKTKRGPLRFFGKAKRNQSEPVNPYVNPPRE